MLAGNSLLLRQLAAAGLFGFEVLVQKIQGLLIRVSASHNGEHALSGLIMRGLGNRNASSRASANFGDLRSSSTDDASNHISRNANVLGLDLLAILGHKGITAVGHVRVRSSAVATGMVAEVGAITGAVERTTTVAVAVVVTVAHGVAVVHWRRAHRRADSRVVQDSTGTSLPVIDQTLSDFADSLLDSLGGSLDFDDALSRLREHLLLRDHAHTRGILDMLDLQALSSDNGTHLVVGDKESNG